jgi:NAD(P)-dependent dehydrogenase (short-subunit alcohol dehydrogenase family)
MARYKGFGFNSTEELINLADTLLGKTVLVTGASSGFGAHFASVLADAHANVILAATNRCARGNCGGASKGRRRNCAHITNGCDRPPELAQVAWNQVE